MRFIIYRLYKYYLKGPTKDVAYVKAIGTFFLLVFMNFVTLLILFNKTYLLQYVKDEQREWQYIKIILASSPFFLLLFWLASKKKIISIQYSDAQLKRGNTFLVIYVIITFISLFGLMLFKIFA